ncbi:MAG: hypothetical protein QXU82_02530 [Candidatus Aenigmatarchaeota archaeon]
MDVKEGIVRTLSPGFPMPAKRIFWVVRSRSGAGVTFRLVNAELESLVRKGVLVKSGEEYSLKTSA